MKTFTEIFLTASIIIATVFIIVGMISSLIIIQEFIKSRKHRVEIRKEVSKHVNKKR